MGGYDDITIAGGDTGTPLNLEKRIRFIEPVLTPGTTKFLDCGCGEGTYVHALRQRYGIDARGVEYLDEKVCEARRSNPSAERIQQGNIEDLCFPDESFDVVLLNEVLEHVPSETKALSEVCRVLRHDGVLIVFSPNRWCPFETHGVRLKKSRRDVKPYVPFIPYVPLALGNRFFEYWARNYGQGQLRSLVEMHGFEVSSHSFVWQTFENISGSQPLVIRKCRTMLRFVANALERTPFLRRFGTSQAIVAKKKGSGTTCT